MIRMTVRLKGNWYDEMILAYPEFVQELVVIDGTCPILIHGIKDFSHLVLRKLESGGLNGLSQLLLVEGAASVLVSFAENPVGEIWGYEGGPGLVCTRQQHDSLCWCRFYLFRNLYGLLESHKDRGVSKKLEYFVLYQIQWIILLVVSLFRFFVKRLYIFFDRSFSFWRFR